MYLTNFERNDGFGAQYQNIIFTCLYCGLTGKEFVYSPFKSMQHNYNNDPDFLKKKEDLINLQTVFKSFNEVKNCPIATAEIYKYVENRLDECLDSPYIRILRDAISINKTNKKNKDYKNVAVHIRRRNIEDNTDPSSSQYYSDDEYFLNAIKEIRSRYDGEKIFHIYSQGKAESFNKFKNKDVILHLNEELEESFCGMVFADILVMSKSSLSYTAALMSDGIIYYQNFWHAPSKKWLMF